MHLWSRFGLEPRCENLQRFPVLLLTRVLAAFDLEFRFLCAFRVNPQDKFLPTTVILILFRVHILDDKVL